MSIQSGTIDLANYKEADLYIKRMEFSTLALQLDEGASVTVKGKHAALDTWVDLCAISLGTLSKVDSMSGPGAFVVGVNGLDEVKFEVSGSGKIHWKEIGE